MSQGYKTRGFKISTVLNTQAFKAGYHDRALGRPFRDDPEIAKLKTGAARRLLPATVYEQGRLLAAFNPRLGLTEGRPVPPEALNEFQRAWRAGAFPETHAA